VAFSAKYPPIGARVCLLSIMAGEDPELPDLYVAPPANIAAPD
jgi:hypothetical protein